MSASTASAIPPPGALSLAIAMIDQPSPADVCFQVGGRKLYSSSALLASASSIWATDFSKEWNEEIMKSEPGSREGDVEEKSRADVLITFWREIEAYSYEVFRMALFWLHTGIVLFSDELQTERPLANSPKPVESLELYELAAFYELNELRKRCLATVETTLNAETIAAVAFSSRVLLHFELRELLWSFMLLNWDRIESSGAWIAILDRGSGGEGVGALDLGAICSFLAQKARQKAHQNALQNVVHNKPAPRYYYSDSSSD